LKGSALVVFAVTANFILKIPASSIGFKNTGFLLASDKLAVKYRPSGNRNRES